MLISYSEKSCVEVSCIVSFEPFAATAANTVVAQCLIVEIKLITKL